jgi:hypothetical protein
VGKAMTMPKSDEELRREIQFGIDQLDRGELTEYDELSFQRFNDDTMATEEELLGREFRKP